MPLPQKQTYTIDYIYSLPEGQRAELIDGQVYAMAPPNVLHQRIVTRLSSAINVYIQKKHGSCEVFVAPFAVFLDADARNYVEPDISVICDRERLDAQGCHGAPDLVIEVTSPSTRRVDYGVKLFKYRTAGVREYWIINPFKRTVNIFDFGYDENSGVYVFDDDIPSCIYPDLTVNIADLLA